VAEVKDWLNASKIDRLDAELILAYVLDHERTWLVAHDNHELQDTELRQANAMAARRGAHEPLAYILGSREFYGREFAVTPDVLIPRPETEQLASAVLEYCGGTPCDVLDVGTGSGAIAVTMALELPDATVTASDISPAALEIAQQNAKKLGAKIQFVQSDLLQNVHGKFDVIVANLPYVAHDWQVSPATKYEPSLALYADDAGERLLKELTNQAPNRLKSGGFLALELDPRQAKNITNYAVKNKRFTVLKTAPFFVIFQIK
jgi:release factor glutamine methyltransferase